MFQKLNVPVLGIVENMSHYHCPHCHHQSALFGEAGGQRLAETHTTQLLGHIPLDATICQQSDKGHPVVLDKTSPIRTAFLNISQQLVRRLALQARDYSVPFSKINVRTEQ